jgi:serine/threonine protein phosphatase 1
VSTSSLFVIGDVHGCASELKTLLNKLPLHPTSTVVFLGDYIDRGPHSREVIDTILKLRAFCAVVTLTGNHEAMLQDFLHDPLSQGAGMFVYNGGGATLASYADEHGNYEIPEQHLEFFSQLKLWYETPDFFFVHAGVPDIALDQLDEKEHKKEMMWVRRSFHRSTFPWNKIIVHGHSPVPEVHFGARRINVDTGCVYEQVLTALELPSRKIYSVMRSRDDRKVHLRDFGSNRIAVRFRGAIPVYVHRGGETFEFETIDYSEFGMLMRFIAHDESGADPDRRVLATGDKIEGHIGSDTSKLLGFSGHVVRVQIDDEHGPCYAVKIEALDASGE